MRVLVTGANGFIGTHTLRRLLQSGHSVVGFDIQPAGALVQAVGGTRAEAVEWRLGDISQPDDVEAAMAGCDRVVHLAGVLTPFCQAQPARGAAINVVGTVNVFESAKRLGLDRVIYASSAGVYGPIQSEYPEPNTHYGAFKLATEGCARAYWRESGIASVGLRPFVVYGPGREVGVSAGVSIACEAAIEDRPYTIPFCGRAGFVYVEDVVDVILAACTNAFHGAHVLNLVGDVHSPEAAVAEIRRHVPQARLDVDGEPLQLSPDIPAGDMTFLSTALRTTPLSEGIARTLAFYQ